MMTPSLFFQYYFKTAIIFQEFQDWFLAEISIFLLIEQKETRSRKKKLNKYKKYIRFRVLLKYIGKPKTLNFVRNIEFN